MYATQHKRLIVPPTDHWRKTFSSSPFTRESSHILLWWNLSNVANWLSCSTSCCPLPRFSVRRGGTKEHARLKKKTEDFFSHRSQFRSSQPGESLQKATSCRAEGRAKHRRTLIGIKLKKKKQSGKLFLVLPYHISNWSSSHLPYNDAPFLT